MWLCSGSRFCRGPRKPNQGDGSVSTLLPPFFLTEAPIFWPVTGRGVLRPSRGRERGAAELAPARLELVCHLSSRRSGDVDGRVIDPHRPPKQVASACIKFLDYLDLIGAGWAARSAGCRAFCGWRAGHMLACGDNGSSCARLLPAGRNAAHDRGSRHQGRGQDWG